MRLEISVHLKRWAKRSMEKRKRHNVHEYVNIRDKGGSIENDETTKPK